MSVNAADLKNPEQDMDLKTREPKGAQKVEDAIQRMKTGKPTYEDELKGILERMTTAKGLVPQGAELHCRDCWEKGRNAAIRTIEGDKGT